MKIQRTLPVAMYSFCSNGQVLSTWRLQKGHWKSDISYTVTGAVGLPLVRMIERVGLRRRRLRGKRRGRQGRRTPSMRR